MTIAYIRTYSNKQQTESQKNAIEQFAKAKKIEIDKWLKDAKNSSKEKNRLEDVIKNLQEGDILIVADVTRLSRKLMEIMHRTSFGKPQNRISPFPEKPDRKRIERRKCNICRISRLL